MADIGALLNPASVAVIGASPDEKKLRGLLLKVMLAHRYGGKIHPVSRSHHEVQGLKACRTIADVPDPVDLAVLVIPSEFVAGELERCGEAGVKAAVVVTSGFAEQVGEEGRLLQGRLRDIAERYGMAVMGPNSEGFANTALSLAVTFSPVMNAPEKPLLPPWRAEGRVAVVAQSGAVGFSFFDRGRHKELPFRYVVTTGNEAALEAFDLVDAMLDEGRTDVFLLLLEDIKTPETFVRVAEKALRAGKPLIAAKLGRSNAGKRATASHTGALAGDYGAYQAMFRHYGVIEGGDAEGMVDLANGFLTNRHRLPAGRRVGICTGSGGAGAWMADACIAAGLEVPELDPATRSAIDRILPPYGTSQNPVDGTAQAIRSVGYAELARMVALSDRVDGVVMITTARDVESYAAETDNLFRVARESAKPIVTWSYTWPHPRAVELFAKAGYPLHTNMRNCAATFAAMAEYRAFRDRFIASRPALREVDAMPSAAGRPLAAPGEKARVLCEYESRRLLAAYGIGSGRGVLATNADAAVAAAAALGGAVALKIQSPGIPHKTEAEGVALGLAMADDVRAAYGRIVAAARARCPQAEIRGVLVDPMAAPGVEVILGVHRDAKFGPMLMAGLGGIHAEVLKDVAFAPVPLDVASARDLIGRLKAAPLLMGPRGRAPADLEALVRLIADLSRFAAAHGNEIAEIDLNPVIVHAEGEGVTIVDALIVPQSPAERAKGKRREPGAHGTRQEVRHAE